VHRRRGPPLTAALDHLVVAAQSLEQGAAWCEVALGVVPGPGGRHALMGTHNRLLALGSEAIERAYLEIIAIDPGAPPPGRARWFGLDDPALQARLRDEGPRLVHWVARTDRLDETVASLRALGHDPGRVIEASRETPHGTLRWRITVPDDGALRAQGALPTWIEWHGVHPTSAMPACGLALRSLRLGGVPAAARRELAMPGVEATDDDGVPALVATLQTPRGEVRLASR
jgi:hypothetical protein